MASPLDAYCRKRRKRNFTATPEPCGSAPQEAVSTQTDSAPVLQYVIHKHAARQLHYDLRLELDGTLKSWAVPKGPCLDPRVKRLAVQVEDHPLDYAAFEGRIPEGHYGAGEVIVWDRGTWAPLDDPRAGYAQGRLQFHLYGEKLGGVWNLVRTAMAGNAAQWLLIKSRDEWARSLDDFDILDAQPGSVLSERSLEPVRTSLKGGRGGQITQQANPHDPDMRAVSSRAARGRTAGTEPIRITHPQRIIDPGSGITKLELAEYYARIAPWALPWLEGRPVALVRGPAGLAGRLFFQRHAATRAIAQLTRLDPALDPGHAPLMVIDSPAALVGAAQIGALELHTWNARMPNLEKPDRFILDLDPDPGLPWARMIEATQLTQSLLDELGLVSFLKTSGGRGMHLVVPLSRRHGWCSVKTFTQAIARHLARLMPERFTAVAGPTNRIGKVFVDYLRNSRGATTVSPYSARAREGLPVSVPIHRNELTSLEGANTWHIRNLLPRLEQLGQDDPWATLPGTRQSISVAMRKGLTGG